MFGVLGDTIDGDQGNRNKVEHAPQEGLCFQKEFRKNHNCVNYLLTTNQKPEAIMLVIIWLYVIR